MAAHSARPGSRARTDDIPSAEEIAPDGLARDLYALVVFLHKDCNQDLFAAFGALEMSISQVKLLARRGDEERELTLKDAGELVGVSLPTASRMVDDLVRRGFIERHEDTHDRRMKRVSVTEHGRAVVRRLNAARLSGLASFTTTLTDHERQALAPALTELLVRPEISACRPEEQI